MPKAALPPRMAESASLSKGFGIAMAGVMFHGCLESLNVADEKIVKWFELLRLRRWDFSSRRGSKYGSRRKSLK